VFQENMKKQISAGLVSQKDAVVSYLLNQVDVYMRLYPLLKFLIGDAFQSEHWAHLFQLLKLRDMKKEKLLFINLLDCDAMILK
jgi:dynein heavy chain 2